MKNPVSRTITTNNVSGQTKHDRIVNGISECIENGSFQIGDILPSVNELSNDLDFARETVVKAYRDLKDKGIIKSKPGVGYFVVSNNTNLKSVIALVLYGFQTFQQEFYNTFRKSLGKNYQIDVFFHHNNMSVYESILDSIRGNYGVYVIAPIQNSRAEELLQSFNPEKLLLIDRYQYINDKVSKVTQEFEQSFLRVLNELGENILKFNKVIIYFKQDSDYPSGILEATKKYMQEYKIALEVHDEFDESHMHAKVLFLTIGDSDLWSILKCAKEQSFEIGRDIGILSHNDSPVKEIIQGGISTFSTDFYAMAKYSANFISDQKTINKIVPSKLISRNSL